jgi:hypothetical protein
MFEFRDWTELDFCSLLYSSLLGTRTWSVLIDDAIRSLQCRITTLFVGNTTFET